MDFYKLIEEEFSNDELFNSIKTYHRQNDSKALIDIEMALWELDNLIHFLQQLREGTTFASFFLNDNQWKQQTGPSSYKDIGSGYNHYFSLATELYDRLRAKVFEFYWKEEDSALKAYFQLFASIFSINEQSSLDIFTTNYDTSLENCFSGNTLAELYNFIDGFKIFGRKGYKFDYATFEEIPNNNKTVILNKLHGSIDWKTKKNNEGNDIIYKTPFTEYRGKHHEHVILYPGYKETPGNQPFKFLHQRLKDKLKGTKLCIVIGFAFRDNYINEIFDDALKMNKKLKLFIWNPVEIKKKFVKGQCIYYKKPFGEDIQLNELEEAIINFL